MYTDALLTTDDETAITVTRNSNVIDLSSAGKDISRGQPGARLYGVVTETFLAAGAATLRAQYVESAAADLSTPTVLFDTGVVGKATWVDGYIFCDVPMPATALEYQGWVYTVATGPMTAGKVYTGVVPNTETPLVRRPTGYVTGYLP